MRSIPEGIRTVDHREPSSESQVPDNPSVMAQGAMPAPLHRGAFGRPYRVALWGSLMEIATAPRAGNKARPYRHALGFAVGAGFIPARAAVRFAEGLQISRLPQHLSVALRAPPPLKGRLVWPPLRRGAPPALV